jgi:hypothetical protein
VIEIQLIVNHSWTMNSTECKVGEYSSRRSSMSCRVILLTLAQGQQAHTEPKLHFRERSINVLCRLYLF